MASKSLVFLLLAACAVQCITGLPSKETKQTRDLQEDLSKLIDKLDALAKKTFDDIANIVQSVLDKLQDEGKKVSDLLDKALQGALQKIDDLIEGAGKDVSTCTNPSLAEITTIHDDAKVASDKCHEDAKTSTADILADAKENMPDVAGVGKELLAEFFACKTLTCKGGVLIKAGVKNTEMTIKIGAIATKASFDLTASSASGALCMNSAITSANLKIVKILADLAKCIKNLP